MEYSSRKKYAICRVKVRACDFVITLVGSLASAYKGVSSFAAQCSDSGSVSSASTLV
jgi:hypothetical protein